MVSTLLVAVDLTRRRRVDDHQMHRMALRAARKHAHRTKPRFLLTT